MISFIEGLKTAAVSVMAGALAGCATAPIAPADRPRSAPPVGTTVTINVPLEVPRDHARAYIQFGKVVSRIRDIDVYVPYCSVEVFRSRSDLENPFTIDKGTFTIERTWNDIDYASTGGVGIYIVASGSIGVSSSGRSGTIWSPSDNERPMETLSTWMRLSSSQQPTVQHLKCSVFADLSPWNYVSFNDIRDTLGDVVTFTNQ